MACRSKFPPPALRFVISLLAEISSKKLSARFSYPKRTASFTNSFTTPKKLTKFALAY